MLQVAGTLDLEAELLPETYAQLGQISLADFDARTAKRFAAFWSGSLHDGSDASDPTPPQPPTARGCLWRAPAARRPRGRRRRSQTTVSRALRCDVEALPGAWLGF